MDPKSVVLLIKNRLVPCALISAIVRLTHREPNSASELFHTVCISRWQVELSVHNKQLGRGREKGGGGASHGGAFDPTHC